MNPTNLSQMIQHTKFQMDKTNQVVLPRALMGCVGISQTLYHCWRSCRKIWWMFRMREVYKSDNFCKLVAGHGMNLIFDQSKIVRVASFAVLVAARVLACVEQYGKLATSWEELRSAWKGHFSSSVNVAWEENNSVRLSPAMKARWISRFKTTACRVQRIFFAFFKMLKEAIVLGMRMTDAMEAFYCPSEVRNESLNLFFVNGAFLMDQFAKNQGRLVDELKKHRDLIDGMFKKLDSETSVELLIQKVEQFTPKLEIQNNQEKVIEKTTGNWFSAWGHKIVFEAASLVGLEGHVGKPRDFFEDSQKQKVLYPDKELITKPSHLYGLKINN